MSSFPKGYMLFQEFLDRLGPVKGCAAVPIVLKVLSVNIKINRFQHVIVWHKICSPHFLGKQGNCGKDLDSILLKGDNYELEILAKE